MDAPSLTARAEAAEAAAREARRAAAEAAARTESALAQLAAARDEAEAMAAKMRAMEGAAAVRFLHPTH